jgi:hypothetical protein
VAQGAVDLLRLLIIEAWTNPLAKGYLGVRMWDEVKNTETDRAEMVCGGGGWKVSSTPGQLKLKWLNSN